MKKFAVSHINWGNYELTTEIVEAEDWKAAAMQHKNIAEMFPVSEDEGKNWPIPETQEEAKQAAFDQDAMINIVEIPDETI